jgi:diacylglycerol kinase (ATP)
MLRAAGYQPVYFSLEKALNDRAALNTGEFVIVAGGDGSLRRVAMKLAGTGRALAPLPVGTANNIARSFGLDPGMPPAQIVAGWAGAPRRHIDLGLAVGPWGRQPFIEGFGLGLMPHSSLIIGDIDEASSRDFRTAADKLHRNRCLIAALAYEIRSRPAKLTIDGRDASGEVILLQAMNIDRVGPSLRFAPSADPSDGSLDLIRVVPRQRVALQEKFKDFLSGETKSPDLPVRRCRRIELVAGPCDLLIDDRIFALKRRSKVEITVMTDALQLILPPPKSGKVHL